MHTRNHGLAQQKCYVDWDRKTPYRLFGGIVYSPGDEIPAEWIEQESPKWSVPPAQMFADVIWDRIAGAWRFINPLDDPQHHRQAVAIGDAVAATKKLETVPVIAIGSADDLATVSFARDTKFLAVFVSNNPFTIAAAEAFIKDAKARGIAARTIVVGG